MPFTLAVVNTLTRFGDDVAEANLAAAAEYVRRAAEGGARLVCLPETFPGAWRSPIRWTPDRELAEIARDNGVYLVGGFAEPLDDEGVRCFNTLALFGPDGAEVGRYRRTVPAHAPWIYQGGAYWDFDWVPADELPVFETELGTVGLLMCSEVYAPEQARILALKGAEVILLPAGLIGPERLPGGYGGALYDTWRTLAWARAIENLAYTAVCSNIPEEGRKGFAMICAPEQVLLEEHAEGVHLATVDVDRIRWLREEHDRTVVGESPWRTKPGTLRDWRRKEVFAANPILGDS